MDTRTYNINLRNDYFNPVAVGLSQYDEGVVLAFNVYDGTDPADFAAGTTAQIMGIRPSGVGFDVSCTLTDNVATVSTITDMTGEAGIFPVEIRFYNSGVNVGTCNFIFAIEKAAHPDGTIDADITHEQDIVDKINQILIQTTPDTTLSEAGVAADSKAVGDNIRRIDLALTTQDRQIGNLGTRLTEAEDNIAANAVAIEELKNRAGLTEEAKAALLACFRNVAWINDQGQTYYDALEAALISEKSLLYISATFDPGQNTIYGGDSLDVLKEYLVVTAYYDDNTSAIIYNYTLSGSLVVGTNTITVLYSNKTTTFVVNAKAREYLISDLATFYWGWGYISKNDGKYYNTGNHTQISADVRSLGLSAGDTISIPDYSKYSFTLTGVEKSDSSLDYIVQGGEQDYTLTASDARIAAVIVIQKLGGEDLTNQEKVYVEGNAKVIKG